MSRGRGRSTGLKAPLRHRIARDHCAGSAVSGSPDRQEIPIWRRDGAAVDRQVLSKLQDREESSSPEASQQRIGDGSRDPSNGRCCFQQDLVMNFQDWPTSPPGILPILRQRLRARGGSESSRCSKSRSDHQGLQCVQICPSGPCRQRQQGVEIGVATAFGEMQRRRRSAPLGASPETSALHQADEAKRLPGATGLTAAPFRAHSRNGQPLLQP